MTEHEAIKQLQVGYLGDTEDLVQAKHIAIKALEEIPKYKNGDCMNNCEHYDNCSNYIYSKGYNKAIDEFAEKMKELSEVGEISVFGWNRIVDEIAEQIRKAV